MDCLCARRIIIEDNNFMLANFDLMLNFWKQIIRPFFRKTSQKVILVNKLLGHTYLEGMKRELDPC